MILGKHSIIDIYDCKCNIDDISLIKDILITSAREAHLHVVDLVFHKFDPVGISGVLVLAESHIAIHTWPEHNFVSVDAFTCGTKMDPSNVILLIKDKLKSTNYKLNSFNRGEF